MYINVLYRLIVWGEQQVNKDICYLQKNSVYILFQKPSIELSIIYSFYGAFERLGYLQVLCNSA